MQIDFPSMGLFYVTEEVVKIEKIVKNEELNTKKY